MMANVFYCNGQMYSFAPPQGQSAAPRVMVPQMAAVPQLSAGMGQYGLQPVPAARPMMKTSAARASHASEPL